MRGRAAVVLAGMLLMAAAGCGAADADTNVPSNAGTGNVPGLARGGPAPEVPTAPKQAEFAPGRVIVKLKNDVVRAMAANEEGLKYESSAGALGAQVYKITDGMGVEEKVAQLQAHPAVDSVEPDYKVHVFGTKVDPNDEDYGKEWHLAKVQMAEAWAAAGTTGSASVKVCHVDSGIRVDHPDLVANVVKGWNFVPPGQIEGQPPPAPSDPAYLNYNDTYGHGTHTAGIIGAVGNNKRGIAGVNWNVKLYVCRFIWNDGSGYISDAMKCISLCSAEGAMITSNSWGGIAYSDFLKQEILNAQKRGQLFVVASGNSGQDLDAAPLYPAAYKDVPNMISVASVGTSDDLSSFSNIGANSVDVAAPGEAIFSTTFNGGYGLMWGTSMATPIVSGIAALLQAQAQAAGVTLTYQQLMKFLLENGDKVPQLQGRIKTGMRVNALKSVLALSAYLKSLGPRAVPSPTPSPGKSAVPVPPVVRPSPSPSPSPTSQTMSMLSLSGRLVCGTSMLRGKRTSQSSTAASTATGTDACGLGSTVANAYKASRAVDGSCQGQWTQPLKGSCSMTARQDNPWWHVDMGSSQRVMGVALTTRSDCSWADLGGAKILVGSRAFTGPADLSSGAFATCATVPAAGLPRGQRKLFSCSPPLGLPGRHLAVYLPKKATRLTLCEVDVVTQDWLIGAARGLSTSGRRRAAQ